MTRIRERNTAWYETIRSFFISDDEIKNESSNDKGYQEWKKANADIIDEKSIANLEKMLEHKDKNKRKLARTSVVEKTESVNVEDLGLEYQQKEQEEQEK